jgi:hypothetical protein
MQTCSIISIILLVIIAAMGTVILWFYLEYKRLKAKIFDEVDLPDQEDKIEDRYFQERIEKIKKKLK